MLIEAAPELDDSFSLVSSEEHSTFKSRTRSKSNGRRLTWKIELQQPGQRHLNQRTQDNRHQHANEGDMEISREQIGKRLARPVSEQRVKDEHRDVQVNQKDAIAETA